MSNSPKLPFKSKGMVSLFIVLLLVVFGVSISFKNSELFSDLFTSAFGKSSNNTGSVKGVSFGQKKADQTEFGSGGSVLAVEDEVTENSLIFRLPVYFFDVVHGATGKFDELLEVGTDLSVGNDVVIGNDLEVGGILISEAGVTAPNVLYSVSVGEGLTAEGTQDIILTNSDLGSAQSIFKNFKFDGTTISAGSNDDTLTFESGEGIALSADGKKVTVTAVSDELNVSGWNNSGTNVLLSTITHNVGIGTTTAGYKLHVVGSSYISDGLTVSSGINNSSSGITNAGPITGASGFTSSGTITFSGLNTGILHTNVNGVVSSSAINLAGGANEVSGSLPVSNGGTGLTSASSGQILYASAANTFSALGIGSEGEVLTVSSGIPAWGVVSGGGGGEPCATCIVNNPGSTQTITPTDTTATGLSIRQASGGTVDIFSVASNDGSTKYFRVDSSGNVLLGSGVTSAMGNLSIAPAGTDPITLAPVAQGLSQYSGTITSLDLTANRTWTFPDDSGVICLASGNCSGTSAAIGGSGTADYLSKWSSTFGLTNSVLYDDGTNIGIGSTSPSVLLDVNGRLNASGLVTFAADLQVDKHATISGSLRTDQSVDFNSTLGVSGDTTLGSALGVTGNGTFGGNVGIGSSSPAYKLDLVGEFNLTDAIRVAGDAGTSGYVLTSSAGGANTWMDPDSLTGSGLWAKTLNVFHPKNALADVVDLTLGGTSTASANIHLQSSGKAYFSGNVGIGTNSPVSRLEVKDNGYTGSDVLGVHADDHVPYLAGYYNDSYSTTTGLMRYFGHNDGTFYFVGANNERVNFSLGSYSDVKMSINESGVGIGYTDSGTAKLAIAGGNIGISTNSPQAGIDVITGAPQLRIGWNGSIGWTHSVVSDGGLTVTPTGTDADYAIDLSGATDGDFSINTDDLFIDTSSGNVGIGSTSPGYKLDVSGSLDNNFGIRATNTNTGTSAMSALGVANGSKAGAVLLFSDAYDPALITLDHFAGRMALLTDVTQPPDGVDIVSSAGTGDIRFYSGGYGTADEAMRIDSSGNVGIGTTTASGRLTIDGGGIKLLDPDQGITFGNSQEFWVSDSRGMAMQARGGVEFYINANNSLAESVEDFNIFADVTQGGGSTPLFTVKQSGNVGIGSTAPATKLDVAGNIGVGVYPNGEVYHNGDTDTKLDFGNNKLRLQAGGGLGIQLEATIFRGNWANQTAMDFSWDGDTNDGVLFVDVSTENVGIGTISPSSKLEVVGDSGIDITDSYGNTGNVKLQSYGVGSGYLNFQAGGTNGAIAHFRDCCNTVFSISGTDGESYFSYDLGVGGDFTVDTNSLFVDSTANNVGIGTTSPGAKLDVDGTIYFGTQLVPRADTNTKLAFGTDQVEVQAGGLRMLTMSETGTFAGNVTGNLNSHNIDFLWEGDTNADFFVLDASAENVGIGTNIPGEKLDVVGSARFSAVGSGTYSADLNITADGTLTTSSSDIRLKENQVVLENTEVLNKVLQLQTYTFDWKENGSSDIGMMAQEVSQIFPEITFTNQVDGYMGINYSRVPTLLISAIQEQQKLIKNLEVQISQTGEVISEGLVLGEETQSTPTAQEELSQYMELSETVWSFVSGVTFGSNTLFEGTVEYLSSVMFRGNVEVDGELVLNENHAGSVAIPAGKRGVKVNFSSAFTQVPIVTATATTSVEGSFWITQTTERGFVIEISQAQSKNVEFNWQVTAIDSQEGIGVEVLDFDEVVPEQQPEEEPSTNIEIIPEATSAAVIEATESAEVSN